MEIIELRFECICSNLSFARNIDICGLISPPTPSRICCCGYCYDYYNNNSSRTLHNTST